MINKNTSKPETTLTFDMKQSCCNICLLAENMKTCQTCIFNVYNKKSQAVKLLTNKK